MSKGKSLQKQKKEDGYDWMVMPDAYFATALLLCDNLLKSQHTLGNGRKIIDNSIFKKYFRSPHYNHEVIRPLVFNFKQGIELYVKGLAGYHSEEYLFSHDIREIFEEVVQRNKKSNSAEKYKLFVKLHADTWPIIQKYYFGLYIPEQYDYAHPDKMNISERYPRCGEGYDLGRYYSWVTIEKIEEIKRDILALEKIFSSAKRV